MNLHDYIASLQRVEGAHLRVAESVVEPLLVADAAALTVEVAADCALRLVVLHSRPEPMALHCMLGERAHLVVVEWFEAAAAAEVHASQAAASRLKLTTVALGSATTRCTINLDGPYAESEVNGVFAVGEEEHAVMQIRTNHNVADCRSSSQVRGLAGGRAVGEFRGMVYVAPDAQRTDAYQQNRNMLLSDTARIDTLPQLEIYADDVKCSHGATVGQMDQEAVYYMRQRGIDEQQARRLQLAGFVGDLVMQCGCETLCAALQEELTFKLEKM